MLFFYETFCIRTFVIFHFSNFVPRRVARRLQMKNYLYYNYGDHFTQDTFINISVPIQFLCLIVSITFLLIQNSINYELQLVIVNKLIFINDLIAQLLVFTQCMLARREQRCQMYDSYRFDLMWDKALKSLYLF